MADSEDVYVFLDGRWQALTGLSSDQTAALIEGLRANREAAYAEGYEAGLLAGRAER